jgi:hypothetical protein
MHAMVLFSLLPLIPGVHGESKQVSKIPYIPDIYFLIIGDIRTGLSARITDRRTTGLGMQWYATIASEARSSREGSWQICGKMMGEFIIGGYLHGA